MNGETPMAPIVENLLRKVEAAQAAHARNFTATDPEPDDRQETDLARWRVEQWERVIPPLYRSATVADFGPPVDGILTEWVRTAGRRPNLVLLGAPGVGKTHAAIGAVRADFDAGHDVMFSSTSKLFRALTPGSPYEADTWDAAQNVSRLVLDDVGAEGSVSDWRMEVLASVLDERRNLSLPTVATSNLTPEGLEAKWGERISSRLLGDAVLVRLAGADRRFC